MSKIGRNDPCPCGSGKKYKHCHLGSTLEEDVPTDAGSAQADSMANWKARVPLILGVLGGVAGGFFFYSQGLQPAISVWAGTLLFVGGWVLFNNPPPSNPNSGDPAGLNFGRKD